MIVAGIQMDIAWERPEENFRRARKWAERAVREPELRQTTEPGEGSAQTNRRQKMGADLLVFPEMFATGFSMDAGRVSAFADETREFLAGLAIRLSVHVLGGYAEPFEPRPANACSIFAPDGREILHFQKLHPFSLSGEENHYVGGQELKTAEVKGVRVTPLICYDLRFPEPFRIAAHGTDLFCIIANWPEKRRTAWSSLLRARATENQAFVLGVNRVGSGGGEPHTGDSVLFDPVGRAVAGATADGPSTEDIQSEPQPRPSEPGIILGEVNPELVARIRGRFSFLKDRKPGLYRRLEEESERD